MFNDGRGLNRKKRLKTLSEFHTNAPPLLKSAQDGFFFSAFEIDIKCLLQVGRVSHPTAMGRFESQSGLFLFSRRWQISKTQIAPTLLVLVVRTELESEDYCDSSPKH